MIKKKISNTYPRKRAAENLESRIIYEKTTRFIIPNNDKEAINTALHILLFEI